MNATATRWTTIERVCFDRAAVRPSGRVLARIDADPLDMTSVQCFSETPGFSVRMLPNPIQCRSHAIVGLAIDRVDTTLSTLCLIRFRIGDSSALASLTVLRG